MNVDNKRYSQQTLFLVTFWVYVTMMWIM